MSNSSSTITATSRPESNNASSISNAAVSAEELKRKRLEAWRKRQQEQKQVVPAVAEPKESLSQQQLQPVQKFSSTILTTPYSKSNNLSTATGICFPSSQKQQPPIHHPEEDAAKKKRGMVQISILNGVAHSGGKIKPKKKTNALASANLLSSLRASHDGGYDDDEDDDARLKKRSRLALLDTVSFEKEVTTSISSSNGQHQQQDSNKTSRWDLKGRTEEVEEADALELFMKEHIGDEHVLATSKIDNLAVTDSEKGSLNSLSKAQVDKKGLSNKSSATAAMLEYLSWKTQLPQEQDKSTIVATDDTKAAALAPIQLSSEMKTEKHRREELLAKLKQEVQELAASSTEDVELQRLYNDDEGGVMEEAERALDVLTSGQYTDAREVLAELNKKKELKAIDHSSISYTPINKNLYICPKKLSILTEEEILERRAKLKIKVRGLQVPAPISDFRQAGLSDVVLQVLTTKLKIRIDHPFPIQAQCLPVILAGRDCIGIAKTGSGKTLAYLLPMIRHILAQPDLGQNESGPIGLVLVPARELATQIHSVCKMFAKCLGLKTCAIYGGAGVAEQIADLKRGCHIVIATPGRMIDILTMQAGKLLSLARTSFLVLDESDRLFDMGFGPQIQAIAAAIRPDRQLVCFSATFPKTVENLARKSLKYPVEVIVGGRSVASDNITQYGEVIQEQDKFLRLLQLLGEHVDEGKKAIVFVDTQAKADSVFEQLTRCGYCCLSLHGGKEQEDRDSTISDFKQSGFQNVLVATSVAGRGLDVQSCACVINYSPPNHVEDYVHRVGRTGRANMNGVAYTFVNPVEEAKFAPVVVRAMSEAGQLSNISPELRALSDAFKEKVKKGEAKWAGSGYKGKGYSYDSSELTDAQKIARIEKREALIEAGLLDPDEKDPFLEEVADDEEDSIKNANEGVTAKAPIQISAELLALPGMQEALMRKAGMLPVEGEVGAGSLGSSKSLGSAHFYDEFEINDYPREARWKITQKETTSRIQDEFQTAITLKGEFFSENRVPAEGERKLYLHLEAQSEQLLRNCVHEIRRILNEETLRVSAKGTVGSHRYSVLG